MTNIHTILRDPLLHFLAAGLLIFGLFDVLSPDEADQRDDLILVDRAALLTFVQYRMRAFEPELAAARLDGLSDLERERLIADYVREEALHREALALGMDSGDYIIKRRLIQKVEFLAQGELERIAQAP